MLTNQILLKEDFSTKSTSETLSLVDSNEKGLTNQEANSRSTYLGRNILPKKESSPFSILIRQVTTNPLIIILAVATGISFSLGEHDSSYYIFAMIILSIVLGFWNEYSAEKTVEKLLSKITSTVLVERSEAKAEVAVTDITIGDIVDLSPGTIVPADLRIISANNLEINESALTGESKTEFKVTYELPTKPSTISENKNIAFMGTSVENGSGKGIVIRLAPYTEYGKIAKSLTFIKPETEFQKGISGFGKLIVQVILVLTLGIFIVNTLLGHMFLESLLFSLAIAVGLTPELLPVIVTVSLSHGAGKLAKKHVIAKQLISLENLGNMDILCTDKTGTLTEGKIKVVNYLDIKGENSLDTLKLAMICNNTIVHHKLVGNAIDVAIIEEGNKIKLSLDKSIKKIVEEPFDFTKKCMYSIVEENGIRRVIAKGAPDSIIEKCKNIDNIESLRKKILDANAEGLRIIAVAQKDVEEKEMYGWDDLNNLNFVGYISFLDTPKKSAKEAINKLHKLNVHIKIITGDNEIVTEKICKDVGMEVKGVLTGSQIDTMSDEEFKQAIQSANIFARVSPNQKLKVIQSLQELGHTVGYMGDGINDIPSLHASDVGISVNTAVDVAKSSASIVLLQNGLNIIAEGIMEGRRTFNNTIKYILMGTSSNFGNMFSAAGASFFLPFLPMTPAQILLTNGLYDISQLSIPSDNVDYESLIKPRHWDIKFIKNYMIFFGPISSLYDYITFGVMLYIFHAHGALFQTGWFIESIATEILVVFVIRTSIKPFYKSKPSKWLTITCLTMTLIGIALPFTIFGRMLGLVAPPISYFIILIIIILTYLFLVEYLKSMFLKKYTL